MENKLVFSNAGCTFKNFNNKTNTLVIKDENDKTFHLVFDNYFPDKMVIEIVNSNVTIIEQYQGNIKDVDVSIVIDKKSSLNRFSIIDDIKTKININRFVDNHNYYKSMQIDLANSSVSSKEDINLVGKNANSLVIDGIYAIGHSIKTYQTNLNHIAKDTTSKAQIFGINDDKAKISIYTDGYIKNKAVGTKIDQEGRIINLSDSCVGIVLPNLHIDENDVQASHSCSVGSVNKDHLYYLQTRGLDEIQARNILIKGYFNPLLENVDDKNIKEKLDMIIDQRIG